MTWFLALAVLIGCDAPPLTPGGYHLRVDADSFWESYPARFEVLPGGQLEGHGWTDAYRCTSQLSDDDLAILTQQLDAADVLTRGDSPRGGCADETSWGFEIDATEGPAAGLHNVFIYDDCDGEAEVNPDVIAVLDTLAKRMGDATAAGLCTSCPTELAPSACYGDAFGAPRFCLGQTWQTCDATSNGAVIDCDQRPSLECDATMGWIPATTWNLTSATVYRWNDGTSTSYWLVLALDVSVIGPPLDINAILGFVQPSNANGVAVAFEPITISSSAGFELSGQQNVTLSFQMQWDAVGFATIALRERPWDQSPFSPSIPVTLVDGTPPF